MQSGAGISDFHASQGDRPVLDYAAHVVPRRQTWLSALCLTLFGYATLGKGWAYIGYPPVFIGELLLVGGIVAVAIRGIRGWPARLPALALVALMGWGAARTVPFVAKYSLDAIRDAVIWGYALFAFIVFFYITSRPERFSLILRRYGQFASLFLIAMPLTWAARYVLGDSMPHWPWADVAIIDPKAGDVMVHLSGILAFWVAGIYAEVGVVRMLLLAACAGVIGSYERAGMMAFLACFALCVALRPHQQQLHRLAAIVVMALIVLAITAVRFQAPSPGEAKVREVSFDQFLANVLSVTSSTTLGDLDETKDWRLQWWREIGRYTLRGPYFWQGKGFGVNLADDDGFQVMSDHSLRSPHNAHLMMLARAGVPGLAIWTLVQLSWAALILRCYLGANRSRKGRWAGVFLLLLCYWLAFMVNASFDVFLEGPMGGIWFWCVFGLGLAAVWIYQRDPGMLDEDANPARA